MADGLKKRLERGEILYGTMVTLPTPATAEILAHAGFDWLFIDGKHGPLGTNEVLAILQAAGDKVACVVLTRVNILDCTGSGGGGGGRSRARSWQAHECTCARRRGGETVRSPRGESHLPRQLRRDEKRPDAEINT